MLQRSLRLLQALACALFLATVPCSASLIAPPPDLGALARVSRTVVFAEARGSRTELRDGTPYTIATFRVLQEVAGERVGATVEVVEIGGVAGDVEDVVVGSPGFEKGGRYLLFLDPARDGRWQTKMLAYGILREDRRDGTLRPLPEAAQISLLARPDVEPIGVYRKGELLQHLAAVARGASPWSRKAVEVEKSAAAAQPEPASSELTAIGAALHDKPAACQFVATPAGLPVRWFGFETNSNTANVFHTTPGQTGIADGGVGAIQAAIAAWNNHDASVVRLNYAGSRTSTFDCTDGSALGAGVLDDDNDVIFNDPCGEVPDLDASCGQPHWSSPCCGLVARFHITTNADGLHDGETWRAAERFSVVVNNGAQCVGATDFNEVMTHFLGHVVGFGHHTDPDATMTGTLGVHAQRGATISTTDKICASYAYHTFLDVPYNYFAWKFVEAVENAGVMGSCGGGNFCPADFVTRGSMAVFLLKAKEGAGYVPPPCTTPTFSDVPCSDPLAPWIEELVRRNVTAGCGGGQYCPNSAVTRNQMAVFLMKTFEGPAFVPPACTTDPFNDVPCSSPFAPWVKLITDRGITAGCGGGNYCPALEVNRAQMSVFLTQTFLLPTP